MGLGTAVISSTRPRPGLAPGLPGTPTLRSSQELPPQQASPTLVWSHPPTKLGLTHRQLLLSGPPPRSPPVLLPSSPVQLDAC